MLARNKALMQTFFKRSFFIFPMEASSFFKINILHISVAEGAQKTLVRLNTKHVQKGCLSGKSNGSH